MVPETTLYDALSPYSDSSATLFKYDFHSLIFRGYQPIFRLQFSTFILNQENMSKTRNPGGRMNKKFTIDNVYFT